MSMTAARKKSVVIHPAVINVLASEASILTMRNKSSDLILTNIVTCVIIIAIIVFGFAWDIWSRDIYTRDMQKILADRGYSEIQIEPMYFIPSDCFGARKNTPMISFTAKDSNNKLIKGHACRNVLFSYDIIKNDN